MAAPANHLNNALARRSIRSIRSKNPVAAFPCNHCHLKNDDLREKEAVPGGTQEEKGIYDSRISHR